MKHDLSVTITQHYHSRLKAMLYITSFEPVYATPVFTAMFSLNR